MWQGEQGCGMNNKCKFIIAVDSALSELLTTMFMLFIDLQVFWKKAKIWIFIQILSIYTCSLNFLKKFKNNLESKSVNLHS